MVLSIGTISVLNSTFRTNLIMAISDSSFVIVSLRSLLVMMLLPDCYTQYSITVVSFFLIDSFFFFLLSEHYDYEQFYVSTFFFTAIHYNIMYNK